MARDPQSDGIGIRVGIGGWSFEPWRGEFYPETLAQSRELEYASQHVTSIEINSTFYGSQKPATFARWRDETPDNFMFSVKASRYATHRKVLAEAGDSVQRFVDSGISELGPKLGPIVWQFATTKRFEADDLEAFASQLPRKVGDLTLRHVLDVRHSSFMCPEYLQIARNHSCATVFTDSDDYPSFADLTADFVYARLMRTEAHFKNGVAPTTVDAWAQRAQAWRSGLEPADLPRVAAPSAATRTASHASSPRDVFLYFISGAKEKAPAAAMALLKRLAD